MTTREAAGIFQRRCRQIGLLLSGRKSDVIFLASFYSLERLCSPKKGLLVRPDWKRPTSFRGRRRHFSSTTSTGRAAAVVSSNSQRTALLERRNDWRPEDY